MSPEIMAADAAQAIRDGSRMTMVIPRPWRNRPPKFPRGELMCENFNGQNVVSYDPLKIMNWLISTGMIKVQASSGADFTSSGLGRTE